MTYTLDELLSRLQIAFAAMDGDEIAEAINSILATSLRYDGDGTWSERPADRIFVVTPTRDGVAYQVCSTGNRYGALVIIYGQDDYKVLDEFPSIEEAAAYCATRYGVDKVETM